MRFIVGTNSLILNGNLSYKPIILMIHRITSDLSFVFEHDMSTLTIQVMPAGKAANN